MNDLESHIYLKYFVDHRKPITATLFLSSCLTAGLGGILFDKYQLKTTGKNFFIASGVIAFVGFLSYFLLKESMMKRFFNLFKMTTIFYTEPNPLEEALSQLTCLQQIKLTPQQNKPLYDYLQQKQASSEKQFNKITPNLFLGNRPAGYRTFEKILGKKSNVTFNAVVTVFREETINEYHTRANDLNEHHDKTMPEPLYPALKGNEHFYHFPLDDVALDVQMSDSSLDQLVTKLDQAVQFIIRRLTLGEKVLVHCNQGASRSATVMVAYLMKAHQLSLEGAINHVKHCRPCVDVSNFVLLLQAYEKNLNSNNATEEEKTNATQLLH